MVAAETSVRVSRGTLRELDRLREVLHTSSADETIQKLIRDRRSRVLGRMFGSVKGAKQGFTEGDRLENHD